MTLRPAFGSRGRSSRSELPGESVDVLLGGGYFRLGHRPVVTRRLAEHFAGCLEVGLGSL